MPAVPTPPSGDSARREQVRFLDIGAIIGPFGLEGDIRVYILSDFPERFVDCEVVRVGDRLRPYEVESSRLVKNEAVLKLKGIDDPDAAAKLKGEVIRVPIDEAVNLEQDEYFWHQIIGLEVRTESGESLGKVTDILRTGANDVYIVQGPRGEVLVPAIADVVLKIDVKSGVITIRPLPGMLED
jgi:16S rRNA processing protein RimM